MAPTKSTRTILPVVKPQNVKTRRKTTTNNIIKEVRGKRKAECSPAKHTAVKRSALSDLSSNAITKAKPVDPKQNAATKNTIAKKSIVQPRIVPSTKQVASVKTVIKPRQNENLAPPAAPITRIQTRAAAVRSKIPDGTAQKPKEPLKEISNTQKVKTRLSNEFEKTEESLYSTALEEMLVTSVLFLCTKLV